LDTLHHALVPNQLDEAAAHRVDMLGGLAAHAVVGIPIGKRHAEIPAFTRVEAIDPAYHAFWPLPGRDRLPIKQGPMEDLR